MESEGRRKGESRAGRVRVEGGVGQGVRGEERRDGGGKGRKAVAKERGWGQRGKGEGGGGEGNGTSTTCNVEKPLTPRELLGGGGGKGLRRKSENKQ